MAAEKAHAEQPDPLTMLGQVSPPAPEILDRAREGLWSAVAAEMLAPPPAGATQTTGSGREAGWSGREAGWTREHGQED
jgi:hypothetical protein